jgi:hypothetical protein
VLRTLFHPVEGQIGGDFLGTAVAGEDVLFVVGDVSGHGLQAAVEALRLKDLVLSAAVAGGGLAGALALNNAQVWADPLGEALATVFVGRYGQGVLRYASAGHLPGPRGWSGRLLGQAVSPRHAPRHGQGHAQLAGTTAHRPFQPVPLGGWCGQAEWCASRD